jgi:hypothetical protein
MKKFANQLLVKSTCHSRGKFCEAKEITLLDFNDNANVCDIKTCKFHS